MLQLQPQLPQPPRQRPPTRWPACGARLHVAMRSTAALEAVASVVGNLRHSTSAEPASAARHDCTCLQLQHF